MWYATSADWHGTLVGGPLMWYATSADWHGTLVGGPLMWVCHISRWTWDTGGKAPNVGMPHQQMGMGHWWEGP